MTAALALAAGGVLAGGAPAGAAAPAANGHVRLAAHAPAGDVSPLTPVSYQHVLTVAPYAAVTCTLNPSNPFRYYGGPYGGGEEGLASVQCTYTVSEIDVQVGLYRNSSLVAASAVRTVYSSSQATVDTEYPVSPATYQTGAVAAVQFTDGFVFSFPQAYSATVTISS